MIKTIKKKEPEFFDKRENTDNLHITLVAPASRKGLLGPFRFFAKTAQFTREQAETPISKKNALLRGVDTLTAFPPENMPDEVVTEGMRSAMSELSQQRDDIKIVPFVPEHTYMPNLNAEQREQVAVYDDALRLAIEIGDNSKVREIVGQRGEFLRHPLAQVYEGAFETTEAPVLEATKATMGGYISLLRTITSSVFNRPMREIAKLNKKGVRTDFVVPEYDIWMPLDEAIAFFETPEEGKESVVVAERSAHAYLALQADLFGKTMKQLQDQGV